MARLSLLASRFQELLCLGVDVRKAGGGWARPPPAPSRGTGEDMAGHRERSQVKSFFGSQTGQKVDRAGSKGRPSGSGVSDCPLV